MFLQNFNAKTSKSPNQLTMARNNRRHIFPGSSQYMASATQMFPVPEFAACGDAFVPRTTINLRDYYLLYNQAPEDEDGCWFWLWPWHWNWHWNWPWHWLCHWLLAWQWPWQVHETSEQFECLEPYFPEKPLHEPEDFLLYDYYDTESEDFDMDEFDLEDSTVEDYDEEESDDDDIVAADNNNLTSQYCFARKRGELKSFSIGELGDLQNQDVPCSKEGKNSAGVPNKRVWVDAEEKTRITKRMYDIPDQIPDRLLCHLGADAAEVDHGDVVQQ